MIDIGSVTTSFGAAKAGLDLLKAIVDVRDATKLMEIKFELMRLLLQAQETEATLISDKRHLEEHLRELETWDGESTRYQLSDVGSGCVAYTLKPTAQPPEPFHMLCAHCYQKRQKRVLQRVPRTVMARYAYDCPDCRTQILTEFAKVAALGAPDDTGQT